MKLKEIVKQENLEKYIFKDNYKRKWELVFYYDYELNSYVIEIIINGALDYYATYNTKKEYKKIVKEIINYYPQLIEYIDIF